MTVHTIQHDTSRSCFHISQGEGEAILKYHLDNDQNVNFYSTYVPEVLRHHGLAEKLVRHGLRWAKNNHYSITADCWYVNRFL